MAVKDTVRVACLALVPLTVFPASAFAQATVDPQDGSTATASATAPDDIVVTGRYRFLAADTSGTTNLPLAIEKVPQSISLVSNDFIKAADLRTLGDVAQFTPGALFAGNQEGSGSIVKLRGFNAGTAFDGLTINALTYDPDIATIEREEIVKGPSSVVYGAASPGGLVNLVSKSALASTPSYLSASGGSWNRWRLEGQVAHPLDAGGHIRVIAIAAHEEAGSYLDEVSSNKTVLYGGVNANYGSVTGYVHGGYDHYRRTAFDGIPTYADGSIADLPRAFFIGSGRDSLTTDVNHVDAGVNWQATPLWSMSLKANYQAAKTQGPAPYGFDLQPNGDFSLQIQNLMNLHAEDYSIGGLTTYKLDQLGLENSFVTASVLYQSTDLYSLQSQPTFPGGDNTTTANIHDGVRAISGLINSAVYPGEIFSSDQSLKFLTFSGQAVIEPIARVTLLAGLSYSHPQIETRTDGGPKQNFSGSSQLSYRAGLSYEMIHGLNAYFSYSESFQPQLHLDIADKVLSPLAGKQYEIGAKYATRDKRLLLTAALFDLRQANQGVYDQQGADGFDRYRAVGEVRHRGGEVQALGRITQRWQINAGLSVLNPKISKDDNTALVGKTVTYLPKLTASIFTSYDFPGGIFVSGGFRYVGAVVTSYDGSSKDLPKYKLVDAGIGYTLQHVRLQLNVRNIFNENYYVNNYETTFYGNVVGEPRAVAASVQYTF